MCCQLHPVGDTVKLTVKTMVNKQLCVKKYLN